MLLSYGSKVLFLIFPYLICLNKNGISLNFLNSISPHNILIKLINKKNCNANIWFLQTMNRQVDTATHTPFSNTVMKLRC